MNFDLVVCRCLSARQEEEVRVSSQHPVDDAVISSLGQFWCFWCSPAEAESMESGKVVKSSRVSSGESAVALLMISARAITLPPKWDSSV